jgi:hypothetical protein
MQSGILRSALTNTLPLEHDFPRTARGQAVRESAGVGCRLQEKFQ